MALSVLGSVSQLTTNNTSVNTAVTVPVGTTFAVLQWSAWGTGTQQFSSGTLGGVSFSIRQNLAVSGDAPSSGCAIVLNPPTGSQTLNCTWANSPTEGRVVTCTYFGTSAAPTAVTDIEVDSDVASATTSTAVSVTVDSIAAGIVLYAAQKFGTNPGISQSASVLVDDHSFQSEHIEVGTLSSPGASTSTVSVASPDYSSLSVVSLKDFGSAAADTLTWLPQSDVLQGPRYRAVPAGITPSS